jgi:hypothetical protein
MKIKRGHFKWHLIPAMIVGFTLPIAMSSCEQDSDLEDGVEEAGEAAEEAAEEVDEAAEEATEE